jgi:hypothetical protein
MRSRKFQDDSDYQKLKDKAKKKRSKSGRIDFNKVDELALAWAEYHDEASVRECKKDAKKYLHKKERLKVKGELKKLK